MLRSVFSQLNTNVITASDFALAQSVIGETTIKDIAQPGAVDQLVVSAVDLIFYFLLLEMKIFHLCIGKNRK
jgi:hypothetical protein